MSGGASDKSLGIALLAWFFVFGASMCLLTTTALLFQGSALELVWRLKPEARGEFVAMAGWALALMMVVGTACSVTACGLWRRKNWGRRLALALLAINLCGDVANAIARSDPRTVIGLPIGGLMMAYLLAPAVRRRFTGS